MKLVPILVFLMATGLAVAEEKKQECPMHKSCPMAKQASASDSHHEGVNSRGNHAMGFDQQKTTHHFLLQENGGIIQVTANSAEDTESRDAIRGHLSHIATLFAAGDFDIPMFVHDRVPPGVPVMKEKKDAIWYKYEEVENGGRVVIGTKDEKALSAIHEFLKFQIEDHETGDPLS
jgi:hypothetical protein